MIYYNGSDREVSGVSVGSILKFDDGYFVIRRNEDNEYFLHRLEDEQS